MSAVGYWLAAAREPRRRLVFLALFAGRPRAQPEGPLGPWLGLDRLSSRAPVAGRRQTLVRALHATIVALIRLVAPCNRAAALALAPYGAWVAFATALAWRSRRVN